MGQVMLTDIKIKKLAEPGRYLDERGLYINVKKGGSKSWELRYMIKGVARYMGLGSYPAVLLRDARLKAAAARALYKNPDAPIDPLTQRKELQRALAAKALRATAFRDAAETYITNMRPKWTNAKSEPAWRNTLTAYAYPVIGDIAVEDIEVKHIKDILGPIWKTKTETAKRVQARIESIIDSEKIVNKDIKENPARWKGHLDHIYPSPSQVRTPSHHNAVEVKEMPAFFSKLQQAKGVGARALTFTILTAARTSEAIGAKWNEFDLIKKVWTIPANRTKTRRERRIPLTSIALDILAAQKTGPGDFVFPGIRPGKSISTGTMSALLEHLGQDNVTVHGFRSTFRDWAGECTAYHHDTCEHALGHVVGNAATQAYARGDHLDKRILMMSDWQEFCSNTTPQEADNKAAG